MNGNSSSKGTICNILEAIKELEDGKSRPLGDSGNGYLQRLLQCARHCALHCKDFFSKRHKKLKFRELRRFLKK